MSQSNPPLRAAELAPHTQRSVFGNFARTDGAQEAVDRLPQLPEATAPHPGVDRADLALSRSFVHQFLARAFEYPTRETWAWLCDAEVQATLLLALKALEPARAGAGGSRGSALLQELHPDGLAGFHDDYIAAIGHAARGSCPINEIEYGDLKADPLFQPHRLADLAAFYRAFGMELDPGADERQDHLSVELEFMAVLTAQEAYALNARAGDEAGSLCRDAQRMFLCEHLGRWLPAFARRLSRAVGPGALGVLASFALAFLEDECRRAGVRAGSEDLLLRPADEGGALCDRCGLAQSLPGGDAFGVGE